MTALVAASVTDPDGERWAAGLKLVEAWLMEQSGNTRAAYSSGIGWPYRPDGTWRGYATTRNGQAWLNWCHHAGVHLLDAERIHVLAWIDDFTVLSTDLYAGHSPILRSGLSRFRSARRTYFAGTGEVFSHLPCSAQMDMGMPSALAWVANPARSECAV